MRNVCSPGRIPGLVVLLCLVLVPGTTSSLELFDGNLGHSAAWLHVLDAPAISDAVYWQALGDDVTYHAQFAIDAGSEDPFPEERLVLDENGIVTNWIAPGLTPGAYLFRVREIHSSGVAGSWSSTGTLEVLEDLEAPVADVLYPIAGQTFTLGDPISIQVEVSDDTLLHLARFAINGEYLATVGLMSENFKLIASFGEARTLVFDYQLPSRGKTGPVEISVLVSDVTNASVTSRVTVNTVKPRKRGHKK